MNCQASDQAEGPLEPRASTLQYSVVPEGRLVVGVKVEAAGLADSNVELKVELFDITILYFAAPSTSLQSKVGLTELTGGVRVLSGAESEGDRITVRKCRTADQELYSPPVSKARTCQ